MTSKSVYRPSKVAPMPKAASWVRRPLLVATAALAAAGLLVSSVNAQSSNDQALIE